jgi:hypothetical protein
LAQPVQQGLLLLSSQDALQLLAAVSQCNITRLGTSSHCGSSSSNSSQLAMAEQGAEAGGAVICMHRMCHLLYVGRQIVCLMCLYAHNHSVPGPTVRSVTR